jgi:hypothetical protein
MLPSVIITILNGGLGLVASTSDGVAGLILTGAPVLNKIALDEPKQIFTLAEAEALGLTAAYDTTNETDVHKQISEFYDAAGNGKELWIMIVDFDRTMADVCDVNNEYAVKLLNAARGAIRILGVTHLSFGAFTELNGLDPDVAAALVKAQVLANQFASVMAPVRVLIAGRGWNGNAADLADLTLNTKNRVAVVLAATDAIAKEPCVGLALGRLAANPVQRKISRVKDGSLPILQGYFSDGKTVEEHASAIESINNKGYIILRNFVGKAGYFFASDPTATGTTDDYNSIARGRVIDKALILTYLTYINELDEEVLINTDGSLDAAYVKSLQGMIENAININMAADGEISAVDCYIDAAQNVLVTNKLAVSLKITPVGYSSVIEVELGFQNPNNS